MFSTFEREMLANQRQQDLILAIEKQERIERATKTGPSTNFLASLAARLRGTATDTRLASPTTARA